MTAPRNSWTPALPNQGSRELQPRDGRPSVNLHVERLVIDESLLGSGGERELRRALVEALEQMLPGAIAGTSLEARLSELPEPSGPPRLPAPSDLSGRGGSAGRGDRTLVPAGTPSLLAAGVAQRVAEHVGSVLGDGRPGHATTSPAVAGHSVADGSTGGPR